MTRYLALFGAIALIAFLLMAGMLAQYGYSLTDPKMTPMVFVALLVAAYVAWRINGILKRRGRRLGTDASGTSKTGGFDFFAPKPSAKHSARAARVAAQRRKLEAEGKIEEEAVPAVKAEPDPEDSAPVRVSQSAPIKDRMAARAERVRRAKEQGKL
jgi:hypothetical protein